MVLLVLHWKNKKKIKKTLNNKQVPVPKTHFVFVLSVKYEEEEINKNQKKNNKMFKMTLLQKKCITLTDIILTRSVDS